MQVLPDYSALIKICPVIFFALGSSFLINIPAVNQTDSSALFDTDLLRHGRPVEKEKALIKGRMWSAGPLRLPQTNKICLISLLWTWLCQVNMVSSNSRDELDSWIHPVVPKQDDHHQQK